MCKETGIDTFSSTDTENEPPPPPETEKLFSQTPKSAYLKKQSKTPKKQRYEINFIAEEILTVSSLELKFEATKHQ